MKEKILFKYFSDVLDEEVNELMWSKVVDRGKGIYQLDNIPFYGAEIATDDVFYAKFNDEEQRLTFQEIITYSGNSVILIIVTRDDFDKEIIRNEFREMGCQSEGVNDSYFSIAIPNSINYAFVRDRLDELEYQGIIEFAEPCLSKKHKDEMESE